MDSNEMTSLFGDVDFDSNYLDFGNSFGEMPSFFDDAIGGNDYGLAVDNTDSVSVPTSGLVQSSSNSFDQSSETPKSVFDQQSNLAPSFPNAVEQMSEAPGSTFQYGAVSNLSAMTGSPDSLFTGIGLQFPEANPSFDHNIVETPFNTSDQVLEIPNSVRDLNFGPVLSSSNAFKHMPEAPNSTFQYGAVSNLGTMTGSPASLFTGIGLQFPETNPSFDHNIVETPFNTLEPFKTLDQVSEIPNSVRDLDFGPVLSSSNAFKHTPEALSSTFQYGAALNLDTMTGYPASSLTGVGLQFPENISTFDHNVAPLVNTVANNEPVVSTLSKDRLISANKAKELLDQKEALLQLQMTSNAKLQQKLNKTQRDFGVYLCIPEGCDKPMVKLMHTEIEKSRSIKKALRDDVQTLQKSEQDLQKNVVDLEKKVVDLKKKVVDHEKSFVDLKQDRQNDHQKARQLINQFQTIGTLGRNEIFKLKAERAQWTGMRGAMQRSINTLTNHNGYYKTVADAYKLQYETVSEKTSGSDMDVLALFAPSTSLATAPWAPTQATPMTPPVLLSQHSPIQQQNPQPSPFAVHQPQPYQPQTPQPQAQGIQLNQAAVAEKKATAAQKKQARAKKPNATDKVVRAAKLDAAKQRNKAAKDRVNGVIVVDSDNEDDNDDLLNALNQGLTQMDQDNIHDAARQQGAAVEAPLSSPRDKRLYNALTTELARMEGGASTNVEEAAPPVGAEKDEMWDLFED